MEIKPRWVRVCGWLCCAVLGLNVVWAAEPLPPQQAFRFELAQHDDKAAQIAFNVAPGYYLYRDKSHFQQNGQDLAGVKFPQGEAHQDDFFGAQTILRTRFVVEVPLQTSKDALSVTVQGCSEALKVCYPPFTQSLSLGGSVSLAPAMSSGSLWATGNASPGQTALAQESPSEIAACAAPPALSSDDDNDQLTALLGSGRLLPLVVGFFGFGLLLAFTPCVLPMLPILSSIIVGQGRTIKRWRAFGLSVAYVLGMAVTYTIAGVIAGLSGAAVSSSLQNVWVLSAVAVLFVLLALPMFGWFELQLPAAWQSRVNAWIAPPAAGESSLRQISGLVLMGALSALIVGPCMTAPLAAALLSIAQTGSAWLGGVALFALAMGMGVPLIAVGVLARHWLPKPGPWMEMVKAFFGWLLLVLAWWLLYPVLAPIVFLLGLASLGLLLAYLFWRFRHLPAKWPRIGMALGVMLALLAVLRSFTGVQSADNVPLSFMPIADSAALQAALQAPDTRPVLVDFYADWCVSCREMEHYTLEAPAVRAELARFRLLRVDVTANSAADLALLKQCQLFAPPAMLLFQKGKLSTRVVGFRSATAFLPLLQRVK